MRNAKLERKSVWNGQRWFVLHCALTVVPVIMGCGSEEKIVVAVDDNDGLVVDPTSVPCKGTAWSDDVCIAGGEFIMGHKEIPYTPPPCPPGEICGPGDPPAKDFAPAHVVKLSPYFIDRYAATNAEYKACYDAGMCPGDCKMQQTCLGVIITEYRFTDPLLAAYPVATLTPDGAEAYCLWKGKRLPTEAEWEHAARAGAADRRFPWGDEEPTDANILCNIWQGRFPTIDTGEDGHVGTAPVDAYEPNGYGLYNASGNVWEWCADAWSATWHAEASRATRIDPKGPDAGPGRVMRGGSYLCHASYCNRYRVAARTHNRADASAGHTGFRCAADAPAHPAGS